ncbi:hypothetical protein DFJ77DRAFT_62097 [Powellomyces hirtus]|nr:hypothetical protein DFJ77DRAFT_62097 [Powellomyces hirtus]
MFRRPHTLVRLRRPQPPTPTPLLLLISSRSFTNSGKGNTPPPPPTPTQPPTTATTSTTTTTTTTTAVSKETSSSSSAVTKPKRKLNLTHLAANRKDRELALSAFFATHRPLVNETDLSTAKRVGREVAQHAQEQTRRDIVARYNDEYAKIFNGFTPYLSPSHHKLYNAIDPAVMPASTFSFPSTTTTTTTTTTRLSHPNPSPAGSFPNTITAVPHRPAPAAPTIADYLVYKSINKPLPSSVAEPILATTTATPKTTTTTAFTSPITSRAAAALRAQITQEESDVLAAYYASADANCGMTFQQMMDNSGPAYQYGQSQVGSIPPYKMQPQHHYPPAPIVSITLPPVTTASSTTPTPTRRRRRRRAPVHAISILKRRRMKMKKHKWKKARKDVRDSTRYNKERRRKGGVQREKQE